MQFLAFLYWLRIILLRWELNLRPISWDHNDDDLRVKCSSEAVQCRVCFLNNGGFVALEDHLRWIFKSCFELLEQFSPDDFDANFFSTPSKQNLSNKIFKKLLLCGFFFFFNSCFNLSFNDDEIDNNNDSCNNHDRNDDVTYDDNVNNDNNNKDDLD